MKRIMIVLASAAMFASCSNKQEKTAAASETAPPAPVVFEKKVYVPVKAQPAPQQQTASKKGWSKAAKGTVIGVGSGALLGAVVSKNKAKGAVIGGVIGGGTGYAIGRGEDRKDGRVQPKN